MVIFVCIENDYRSDAIQFSSIFSEVYDIATGDLEIVQIFCIKGFTIEAGDAEKIRADI